MAIGVVEAISKTKIFYFFFVNKKNRGKAKNTENTGKTGNFVFMEVWQPCRVAFPEIYIQYFLTIEIIS